jgi:dihydrofolate reductase
MIFTSHFITLDGVVGSPERWHPAFASSQSMDVLLAQMARSDGMLVGRRTFEEFASWWPHQSDDVPAAKETNAMRKYVVSATLTDPSWGPAEVLAGGPVAAAEELTRRGLTLMLPGSAQLTRTLLSAGLVNEMQLYVDPLVLGDGLRLLDGIAGQLRFALVDSTTLPHGVLHLVYHPEQDHDA